MHLMQRFSSSLRPNRVAVRTAVSAVAGVRPSLMQTQRRDRRIVMHAAEEIVADAPPASEPETSEKAEEAAAPEETVALSPLERARQALESETVDKAVLEAALAELDAEMSRLQERAAAAESRASALDTATASAKDQLLRLTADFDNFRRRTREEKEVLQDSVRGDIVTSLLPVVDNFELARTQVKAETEGEIKINQSYQGLYKQFVEFLRNLGVEAIPTQGAKFDPLLHEAIMQEVDNSVPDGTITMEFRKGFRLGDKLLRPAMVKVSSNEGEPVMSSEE